MYFASTKGLGSGGDGVKLYLPDGANGTAGTLVDSAVVHRGRGGHRRGRTTSAPARSRAARTAAARFVSVAAKSFGASNATACLTPLTNPADNPVPTLPCQPEAASGTGTLPATALTPTAWPGSATVAVADTQCAWKTSTGPEGRDVSGLVFDPSNANVLYIVKNKSWVYRLVKQGGLWVPDTSNGWGAGKQIFFPGSTDSQTNQPDSEGLTVGADGALYVTTERNNAANTIPLNSILRFDPTQSGTQLVATDQWNLTAEFPELHPGSKHRGEPRLRRRHLRARQLPHRQRVRRPVDRQDLQADRLPAARQPACTSRRSRTTASCTPTRCIADHTFHRVAVVDTGMGHVMDVQFDADTQRIWALCDNTCGVVSTVLKVSSTGTIVPDVAYSKPASLPEQQHRGLRPGAELDLRRRHQGGRSGRTTASTAPAPAARPRATRSTADGSTATSTSASRACRSRLPGTRRRSTTPATR